MGGGNADISVEESVAGMLRVVGGLTAKTELKLRVWDGESLWMAERVQAILTIVYRLYLTMVIVRTSEESQGTLGPCFIFWLVNILEYTTAHYEDSNLLEHLCDVLESFSNVNPPLCRAR